MIKILFLFFPFILMANTFNYNISNNTIKNNFLEYENITGKKINIWKIKKNKHLMNAIYDLNFKSKETKINIYNSNEGKYSEINIKIPLYKNAIKELSKTNDLYSAWFAISIIHDKLMLFDKEGRFSDRELKNIVNKNYPKFLKKMTDNNICYGYMLSVEYYKYYFKNKNKYIKNLNSGYKKCYNNNDWISERIKLEYVQRKIYEKLKKGKSK